jgi:hypothetical protein
MQNMISATVKLNKNELLSNLWGIMSWDVGEVYRRLTLFTVRRYGAILSSELGRVKMQATPLLRMTEALEKILEDLQPIQSFFKFIFFWKENFSRREKRDANKNIEGILEWMLWQFLHARIYREC